MTMVVVVIYLVAFDNLSQISVALWVLVICPHKDALLARRHGKRPDPSHDIDDDLPGLEHGADAPVFGAQLGVPVHLGVVESEDAACLAHLDEQVIWAGEDLVGEGAELVFSTNVVGLVDDGADVWVFVENDLGNDVSVREILPTNIQVCYNGPSKEEEKKNEQVRLGSRG